MLNRAFFEGRGDDFLTVFAACVERREITVSEEAAVNLLEAVRSVPQVKTKTAGARR
ncbi:hypothetical protein [Mesorhizobium sp. CN2-181]|uniref:hypothetical protein n=1 Tax=Mesorhizobium yinganensis TaxID=3157707 RepID=UPI0032B7CB51